jgi:anti-sigma-K factor RskA
MGDQTMSTNTTALHQGSAQPARGALAAPLAVAATLIAFAGLVGLNAGLRPAVIATAASDAQVQNALIDVRAGERDSISIGADVVQKALIDVRAGERASRGGAVPTAASSIEFRAGH